METLLLALSGVVIFFAIYRIIVSVRHPIESCGKVPFFRASPPSTKSQTIAWIFMCVHDKPSTLQKIISNADYIDRAIPSLEELQVSLGWLLTKGLIRKDGGCYLLTETGSQLRSRLWNINHPLRETRSIISGELRTMMDSQATIDSRTSLENITQEEMNSAYKAYKTEAWSVFEKVSEKYKDDFKNKKEKSDV